jgi:cell wall-associated NlpC family hydrolase
MGGGSPRAGFDCSGLVVYAFRSAIGWELPRPALELAALGRAVRIEELRAGDLVFFNTLRRAYSHVGIYLGGGRFVHAPSSGGVVRIEELAQDYWHKRFDGARRIV